MNSMELINEEFKDISESDCRKPSTKTIVVVMFMSFIIPTITMALAFLKVRISPNGKYTVLIYDMQAQYMPVFASLRYLGHSEHSLLYSFFGALGNNALLNYKSYIANPLLWATVFVPLEKLPDALYFITLFNIGLCGLSFASFLLFGSRKNRDRRYLFAVLIISCCYALMSFNIAYSMCINWLLEVALLPLMLIGIEQIIEGKKGAVYLFTMTYAVYNSDQLFYMSGIFCVLYLTYRLCEVDENRFKICIRFIICSVLACGLSMPILLPMAYNIMGGRMQTFNSMSGKWFYYPIWKPLKQLLSCQYDSITEVGLPNIFCGTFIPILAVIGVIKSNKKIKSKIVVVCIILFYFVSFSIVVLNQFWHGFTEPNAFPVRYSYTFCAFVLILSYEGMEFFYRKNTAPLGARKAIMVCVSLIAFTELYLNAGYILTSNNLSMGYNNYMGYRTQLKYMQDALKQIDDNSFYRIGRDLPYTTNDGMLYGYNGIGYFSSMFERESMNFLGRMGYAQHEHMVHDVGGTPLTESLLGIKYKILKEPLIFGTYEPVYSNGLYELEYNKNALSCGIIMRNKKLEEYSCADLIEGINMGNSFSYQEYILSELVGERVHIYDNIEYDIEELPADDGYSRHIKMRFEAKNNMPIWIYCKDFDSVRIKIGNETKEAEENASLDGDHGLLTVNGEGKYPFMNKLSTMCTYLGTFKEGDEVEVEAASTILFDNPWITAFDENMYTEIFKELKKNEFNAIYSKSKIIKGNIDIGEEEAYLILIIPYMKGYDIKVDGIKTEYRSYREIFPAIKLERGQHLVEVTFVPQGLKIGLFTSLISIIVAVCFLTYGKKQRSNLNSIPI